MSVSKAAFLRENGLSEKKFRALKRALKYKQKIKKL